MPGLLDTFKEGVQSLTNNFKPKPDSILGVDIGSSAIKLVQLKKEGNKVVLETYGEVALGPYKDKPAGDISSLSTDELTTALSDVIEGSNVNATHSAFSIQSGASLIFVLKLPPLKKSQYNTVIPTEAKKYIPVSLSEVALDWWIIPKHEYTDTEEEQENTQALTVAVRNETLQQYRDIVTASELVPDLFELEVFSIIRSSFGHEMDPVMVVDFGAQSVRVAIVEYGIVKKFHTINRGSKQMSHTLSTSMSLDFEDAEERKKEHGITGSDSTVKEVINSSLSYIFSEMRSVLLEYEKEYQKSVGKIYLAGGGSKLPGFREAISEKMQIDAQLVTPFNKTEHPSFLDDILAKTGPEFAVAIGVALKQLER